MMPTLTVSLAYVSFRDAVVVVLIVVLIVGGAVSRALVLHLVHYRRARVRTNVSLYTYLLAHTAACIKGRVCTSPL